MGAVGVVCGWGSGEDGAEQGSGGRGLDVV